MSNKAGASKVAQSANYKSNKRWERNRLRRLNKLLLEQPNNLQVPEAIKNVRWRRGTPTTPFWTHSMIRQASMFKRYVGKFHVEMFNKNDKISGPALLLSGKYSKLKPPSVNEKVMFQLGTRAHDSWGRMVWGS